MSKKHPSSFWQTANKMTQGMKEVISKQASLAGEAMSKKASDVRDELRDRATDTAAHMTEAIGKKATAVSTSASQISQTWIDQITQGNSSQSPTPTEEVYHVFIGYELAEKGGYQHVTLKSGKRYNVKINSPLENGCKLRLKKCGIQGNDAFVIFHTLFDRSANIYRQINQPVAHSSLETRSKTKCSEAYSVINAGGAVQDLAALDLLDFIVLSANLPREIRQRYMVASQNSRLVALEECLDKTLSSSCLSEAKQRLIKGAYQSIRAGEAVVNLTAIEQLDAILLNSSLVSQLVQQYAIASAISVSITVDTWIQQLLIDKIPQKDRAKYFSVYQAVRDGEPVDDLDSLKVLDGLILSAEGPELSKVVYKLARDRFFEVDDDFDSPNFLDAFKHYKKIVKFVQSTATKVSRSSQPRDIKLRLSSFSGNSVSEGQLGLLGEPVMSKIGIGLIRAAVLSAIASVSEMTIPEKIYLGIAQPETSTSNSSMNLPDLYNQTMLMLDRTIYSPLNVTSDRLGSAMSDAIGGHREKQRILRELEERLGDS